MVQYPLQNAQLKCQIVSLSIFIFCFYLLKTTLPPTIVILTVTSLISSGGIFIKSSERTARSADLAVLSDDLINIPPDEIKDVTVSMTIVGGKVVFRR